VALLHISHRDGDRERHRRILPADVPTPSSSVVVCTRHRPTALARCLSGLAELDHPSYEVIVVDNSDGDESAKQLADRVGAQYVLERRVGVSRARNAGARAARGDIVAFTDDDAVPDPAWLRCHADALCDGGLSATTGRVVSIEPTSAASRAYESVGGDDLGPTAFEVDRRSPHWFELANFGGVGVGGNIAFRRALLDGGWGFREDLGLGNRILGEEHYAFFELIRAGHAIAYVPEAIVRHEPPVDLADVECRKRRTLRSISAYVAMLVVEERGYRLRATKYAWGALSGRRRAWRAEVSAPFASRRQRLVAGMAGLAAYTSARPRAGRRGRRTPPPVPPDRRPPRVSRLASHSAR
jgi:glycosyltransferase involved in cell wall biosynthesis